MRAHRLAVVALLALPLCTPAHAAGYQISPIGNPGAYNGCLAMDVDAGLGFVSFAQNLTVLMQAKLLDVEKGEAVTGTWSVDGSKERSLDDKATDKNIVSAGLAATKEMMALLGDGNQLTVTMGKTSVEFDLAGSKQALQDLGACMDKNVKQ